MTELYLWWPDFKHYVKEQYDLSDWREAFENDSMQIYMSDFLFHNDGAESQPYFKFDGQLNCNEPAPNITVRQS